MIIAIKDKDKVVIGFSGMGGWSGFCDADYVDEENVPIGFSKTGKVWVMPSLCRDSDAVLYDDELISQEVAPKTIITDIIPAIRKKMSHLGGLSKSGGWNQTLTICDDEHIYDINKAFSFYDADDYVCHGLYVELMRSVLDETKHLSAEERILEAFRFVGVYTRENVFPLIITDTKSKRLKKFYNQGEIKHESHNSI